MNKLLLAPAMLAGLFAMSAVAGADPVAATAEVHGEDRPDATPVATTAPVAPVESREVTYARVDGEPVTGFVARPRGAGPGTPGVIVIHEWWGLNDNIRQVTERLAAEGYVALAVDLYGGESASDPKNAMRLMGALQDAPGRANENLRQAYGWLEQEAGARRIGVIGWCLGGQWSLRTALLMPRSIDAAVIYYGSLNTDADALATLEMPVMGNFAEDDPLIPLGEVRAFEETLASLGKTVDVKIYEDAKHAFSNPSGTAYDAAAAKDAWGRSIGFFRRHLQGGEG